MRAIQVTSHGGPEVLGTTDLPLPEPGPGDVRIRIEAAGVNFIDIYQRSGLYPLEPPFTPGMEGAGVVDAVGSEVTEVAAGARVAYAMTVGSYAEYAVVPAAAVVELPAAVSTRLGAAVFLQGLTAHYLAVSTVPLQPGSTALVHAAPAASGGCWCRSPSAAGPPCWRPCQAPKRPPWCAPWAPIRCWTTPTLPPPRGAQPAVPASTWSTIRSAGLPSTARWRRCAGAATW